MRKVVLLVLCALFALVGGDALAQGRREHVRSGDVQALDQIISQVGRSHPGRFYDAEGPFPDGNGGFRYRIKWMTPEGRVIWLNTDARTGRVLGQERSGRQQNSRDRDDERRPADFRDYPRQEREDIYDRNSRDRDNDDQRRNRRKNHDRDGQNFGDRDDEHSRFDDARRNRPRFDREQRRNSDDRPNWNRSERQSSKRHHGRDD